VHVHAAHLPDSPLSLHFGRVVRGRSFGRGRAWADEPVSKILSCDPRVDFCTFVQLVFPALPCHFVSVVSFGWVV